MSDLISREAALFSLHNDAGLGTANPAYKCIRALPAVQPNAAAIRKAALREVLALPRYTPPQTWTSGVPFKEVIWVDDILTLIDNTGKEVMPLDAGTTETQTQAHDIGPGDQAVAGAAQCCMCGKRGLLTADDGGPQCELHDGRWVCSSGCYDVALGIMLKPVAGAAPRRASGPIDSDAGFATSGAEARWIADIDAGVYDDAQPAPWPEGLIHLTNTRRFHVDCATEGCERRVSTRFEAGGISSDYCEPCGRKVALAQKADRHD